MTDAVTLREVAMTRVFAAPRELVWDAWTQPAQLARWWGRRGWSTPAEHITIDLRPGGAFALTSFSDESGRAMTLSAVYREVVAPERLAWESDDGRTATVTFTDLGDGTTRVQLDTTIRATEGLHRNAVRGLTSAWDRLAEHLDRIHPPIGEPRT
jgi:uncharacterized protein YndB with AHSA1/START domain